MTQPGEPTPRPAPPGGTPQAWSPPHAQESRNWAMGAHLSAIVGAALGGLPAFVGPLVVWLLRRDSDPFAAEHGKEALNFQLFTLLVAVVAGVVSVVTLGLALVLVVPLGLAAGVAWLVFTIMGSVKAANGEPYRYPVTLRFIS